jgi:hypothetical protein
LQPWASLATARWERLDHRLTSSRVRGRVGHNAGVEGVVARPSGRRVVRVLLAAGLGAAVLAWPTAVGATKTSIGGNMEGPITVSPGDTVRAGWDLSMPGAHPAATVIISGTGAGVSVACPDGHIQWVGMGIPNQSITIAAGDASWHPSADSSSPTVWQGSAVAPRGLCNGGAGRAHGAVLVANVTSSDSVDMVDLRFHYSDRSPGAWSAAKAVQPSSSGAPPPASPPTPPPVRPGAAPPPRTQPPAPAHTTAATAGGTAPAASPSSSAAAHPLTPATGSEATPDETGTPPALQQSVTALRGPLTDAEVSTTPPALLGLWSAGGVVVIAIAVRWRWRRGPRQE